MSSFWTGTPGQACGGPQQKQACVVHTTVRLAKAQSIGQQQTGKAVGGKGVIRDSRPVAGPPGKSGSMWNARSTKLSYFLLDIKYVAEGEVLKEVREMHQLRNQSIGCKRVAAGHGPGSYC